MRLASLQAIVERIGKIESWCMMTRNWVKELAYGISMVACGAILLINEFKVLSNTANFFGADIFTVDLLKDQNYTPAAMIICIANVIYLLDTIILIRKKQGLWIDCCTFTTEIVFWAIVFSFGIQFSSNTECSTQTNIFPCMYGTSVYPGRWPLFMIVPIVKLVIDCALFGYFRLVQKRTVSLSHGQSVCGLLLDVQYLLCILWFGNAIGYQPPDWVLANSQLYVSRHVLGVVFAGLMCSPLCIFASFMLAGFEYSRKNKLRSVQLCLLGLFFSVAFVFGLALDGVAGQVSSKNIGYLIGLTISMMVLGGLHCLANAYQKFRNRECYNQYIIKASPLQTEQQPMLIFTTKIEKQTVPQNVSQVIQPQAQEVSTFTNQPSQPRVHTAAPNVVFEPLQNQSRFEAEKASQIQY